MEVDNFIGLSKFRIVVQEGKKGKKLLVRQQLGWAMCCGAILHLSTQGVVILASAEQGSASREKG